jgi:hypothetical protein
VILLSIDSEQVVIGSEVTGDGGEIPLTNKLAILIMAAGIARETMTR